MFLIDKQPPVASDWIDSSDIFHRTIQILGNAELAEKALDEALVNNAWHARAAVGIVGPDYGEVPISAPREFGPFCYERFALNEQPVLILPAFWRGGRSIVPGRLWNWQQGIFAHAASAQGGLVQWEGDDRWFVEVPKRWVAFDVQFNAQKASDYLDKLARHVDEKRGSARAKPRKRSGHGPRLSPSSSLESNTVTCLNLAAQMTMVRRRGS
ncbi:MULTISPECIES: hypothetical protein [unclassified Sphingomonas]|uniref:hypothetical protein n=1 Tax=unclassified Sphingomonas TaxID=196159 RepID=UPI002151F05A|nr:MULTISPECIES: hypothetical protein [unclassified Sphingomonas]MCR5870707.1 hypothetical protein [Sphingomonas sp. J344]UUY00956.1 hypothetical protein LRS08_07845 [Sphingomonas sp. J315]